MNNKLSTGQLIAFIRKRAGFKSQEQLADAMTGFNRGQIAAYEADANAPGLDFVRQFKQLTGCTYEELLEGKEPLMAEAYAVDSKLDLVIDKLKVDETTKAYLQKELKVMKDSLSAERKKREQLAEDVMRTLKEGLKKL